MDPMVWVYVQKKINWGAGCAWQLKFERWKQNIEGRLLGGKTATTTTPRPRTRRTKTPERLQ